MIDPQTITEAKRALGRELAALREAAGKTQEQLAQQIKYGRSTIANAETGYSTCRRTFWEHADQALHADGALLAGYDDLQALTRQRHAQTARLLERTRRNTVRVAQEPKVEVLPDEDIADVLRRMHGRARAVDPEIVDQLGGDVRDLVERYEELDSADYLPSLRKQRVWLEELIDECGRPRQRMQLFAAASATSGLLGYVALGCGKFGLARAYCAEAHQLGGLAEETDLQTWARGLQSFCAYYAGDYPTALDLARDGLRNAETRPQGVRLAINGAARALAKLGDADGVDRLVGQAYELQSHHGAPTGFPSSIGFGCYSKAQVASNAATAYLSLGMPDQAQHYIDEALPDISRYGSAWSHALVTIDLATALVQSTDADLDRASQLVQDSVVLTRDRPIISVRQRASEFAGYAAQRWGVTRQVAAVRDVVSGVRWTID